ncbi:conserved hypothetical protein [Parafrankia sp. EAN1pec]|uniref:peptidase inhibitor family I36 protein n=1 Tax=Parafrankia sp. (strain EAN1pec) TaxID=298653 RepID=UPI0000543FF0|nr:conserved hypothetical protein [Frankia sp. EAN1pec]
MNRTAIRRGMAIAFGGAFMAGMVAVGQPAGAATGSVTSPKVDAPAPASVSSVGAASTKASRNSTGGVGAAHLDGACNLYSNGDGDLCLWYFQNYSGSHADFFFSDSNLNNNQFNSPGAGQGSWVGNNSESVWNYDRHLTARVYTGVNYTGTNGTIAPNSGGNFTSTFRNNVESFQWI